MTAPSERSKGVWLWLLAVLVAHAALVLPTVGRQGVNWDEQTDLDIASVYASSAWGLFHGSPDDVINMRLPMYSAGLLFRLVTGEPLRVARLLSCLMAASTILAVFVFCALELDRTKGIVAAALLATSPYFLYFGKQALTEGDVWIAAAVAWLLVCAAHYRRRPTLGRAAVVGIALGVTLSAKISGVALIPALAWVILTDGRPGSSATDASPTGSSLDRRPLLLGVAALLVWLAVNVLVSLGAYSRLGLSLHPGGSRPVLRVAAGILLAVFTGRWIAIRRDVQAPRLWTLVTILMVGALTFFLVPPVHTTNPWILGALGNELLSRSSSTDAGFLLEAALFHLEVITLKSSLVVGIGLWVALAFSLWRRRRHPGFQLAHLSVGTYAAFVLLLPWAQTRYMMPVVPLLAIFAADALVDLHRRRAAVALSIAAIAAATLAADLWTSYPDLNLNGYRWVGERYLTGRSTLGYRGVVHTPSDGIQQALRWVGDRAGGEDTVVTFFGEDHITRAVLPDPSFAIQNAIHHPVALERADWVVTSINYDLVQRREENVWTESIFAYPYYDRRQLEREFTRVFAVTRAFDIEMAAVWRRNPPDPPQEREVPEASVRE